MGMRICIPLENDYSPLLIALTAVAAVYTGKRLK